IELQIIGDEEIQVAVPVEIHERAAGSPPVAFVKQARLFSDVGERAVAIVPVEDVLRPAGNEDILETVVVVVSNGYAAEPAQTSQAGWPGDLGEGAVAAVFVEAV